ncbi:MAG: hypothetical protein JWP88_323 [Flaviaesturariibacter sp.]|nr:hypothetical protein [Flaviaesturariibacter sp.]
MGSALLHFLHSLHFTRNFTRRANLFTLALLNNKKVMATKKNTAKDPCWKGYEKEGIKKKGGKNVPNCVKKESKRKSGS